MEIIEKNKEGLKKLCEKYNVAELYLFGSFARGEISKKSDIDFLVRFSGVNPVDYFDNYIDFKESIENLFSRNIDLVEMQTIKNPDLKKSINRNKIKLYGREDSKMAV